jgi:hypothetical protein
VLRVLLRVGRWGLSAGGGAVGQEYERRRAKLMTRLHGCDHSTHHEGERSLDAAASAQWNETEPADPWRCMPDPVRFVCSPHLLRTELCRVGVFIFIQRTWGRWYGARSFIRTTHL